MRPHSRPSLSGRRLRRRLTESELLRGPKQQWDFLHIAEAYAARQQRRVYLSLSRFAVEHGALASALFEETRGHNLVLWHGASLARATKILEHGFVHYKGVWMALGTSTPLSFARHRGAESGGPPAVLISVVDMEVFRPGVDFDDTAHYRFRDDVPSEVVQYLLTDREFRCVGRGRVLRHALPTKASFVSRGGRGVTPTQNPAVFDAGRGLVYTTADDWLGLQLADFFVREGRATALETLRAVYANRSPRPAIPRDRVVKWIVDNCETAGRSR